MATCWVPDQRENSEDHVKVAVPYLAKYEQCIQRMFRINGPVSYGIRQTYCMPHRKRVKMHKTVRRDSSFNTWNELMR